MRMGVQSFWLPIIAVPAKGISGRRKQFWRGMQAPSILQFLDSIEQKRGNFVDGQSNARRRVSPETVASYRDTFRLLLQFLQCSVGKEPSRLTLAVSGTDLRSDGCWRGTGRVWR